ncbi:MAG: DUF4190 domain-containing protein [Actinomycetota bacterium]|nr:DUF4190 domain-containing protein [Actinomycetota bacterium]
MSSHGPQDTPQDRGVADDVGEPMPSCEYPVHPERPEHTEHTGRPAPATVTPASPGAQAVVAFVLGIFSVFGLWLVGPFAIVVANRALRRVDAGELSPSSRGLAVVGRVLGIIGTVLLVLGVVVVIGGVVLFRVSSSTAP